MLIHLSNFKGMPVASQQDGAKIAEIFNTIIHPKTGELVGFWLKTLGFFGNQLALSARDVIAYDLKGLVVLDKDSLVDPGEIQAFSKFDKKKSWIGKKVVAEDGEVLGAVEDLVLETDLDVLSKIYVGGFLRASRVISRDQIKKVEDKKIIIRGTSQSRIKELAMEEV